MMGNTRGGTVTDSSLILASFVLRGLALLSFSNSFDLCFSLSALSTFIDYTPIFSPTAGSNSICSLPSSILSSKSFELQTSMTGECGSKELCDSDLPLLLGMGNGMRSMVFTAYKRILAPSWIGPLPGKGSSNSKYGLCDRADSIFTI